LKKISRARASALIFGGAAFCMRASRAQAQSLATVRIATIPIEPGAEVYFAKERGFFAKAGLDADIQPMQGGSAIAAALVSGAIDIGFLAIDALAAIHRRGAQLVALAPGTEYLSPFTTQNAALLVPANSPVQKAQDLNGKVVAVISLNSLTHTAVRTWMDKNGGDASTVKFVEIPSSAMGAALAANRVDAAEVAEPFIAEARKSARVLAYGFDSIAKRFITTGWCSTPQWAKDHMLLANRFAAAMRETAAWANDNPQESGAILATDLKLDPIMVAGMTRVRYTNQLEPALMQPLIDATAHYNGFSTFPAQELIYTPSR
jgi:NitT/TauT family transport system substrate-binding protein